MSPAELRRLVTRAGAGASVLLKSDRVTDAQLARALKVTPGMVHRWRNGAQPRNGNLARLQALADLHCQAALIRREADARVTELAHQAAEQLSR